MENEMTSRTTRRRDKIHKEILDVASKLICEKGSAAVSLEEISRLADVARKTVYNHFMNKEALINELIMPVCEHARNYLQRHEELDHLTLDHIWDYCIELWETKELNIVVLYKIAEEDYSQLEESRHGFVLMYSALLERIEAYESLDKAFLNKVANIIYDTYMPILQNLSDLTAYQDRFRRSMTGLVQGIMSSPF